ncbi:hypothetical protein SBA4_2590001 [Candidatus Sulfopaludibacter sp. SbA4]|nr:hypothetical protein SBA4_2590001 [Candidatus Sulfopaludibacter sp. SbA4]
MNADRGSYPEAKFASQGLNLQTTYSRRQREGVDPLGVRA